MDTIVCVSKQNAGSFAECYPDMEKKLKVIYNPNDGAYIYKKSEAFYPPEYAETGNSMKIFSSGTVGFLKGTDFIIDTVKTLPNEGYRIKWFIAGNEGKSEHHKGAECVQRIKNEGLERDIILLGYITNPYPYFKHCDIYVHPSRFEGLSVAIQEAKILCKPILVTNHSSADEVIEDGTTGVICDIDAVSLTEKLKVLINDKNLRVKLSSNLRSCIARDETTDALREIL
jgi:glycosyltransferase involved in cell wall biosynthesis